MALQRLSYHVYSIWLFTLTDLKTIVGPQSAFAVVSILSGEALTTSQSPGISVIARRVPRTVYWTWINLLPFAIANQRQPKSIQEDAQNKPWRSMPSKRLSESQAKYLMLVLYPIAITSSFALGGIRQSAALVLLGYWYNDLGGADKSCIVRNFINACGFLSFATGAAEVLSASERFTSPFHLVALKWFEIIGAIVFSSVQTQDMYDQEGDSLRGRKTVPLVMGDSLARLTIAIAVTWWSFLCPAFWKLGIASHVLSCAMGGVIVVRTLSMKTVAADKTTFRIWNLWLVVLYSFPLLGSVKNYESVKSHEFGAFL